MGYVFADFLKSFYATTQTQQINTEVENKTAQKEGNVLSDIAHLHARLQDTLLHCAHVCITLSELYKVNNIVQSS